MVPWLCRVAPRRKSGPAWCTVKVDLRKAYDSLNWSFIKDILTWLNFPQQFIEWVVVCVTSPSFTLSINGSLCAFFKGKKGIRQGDSMSPLLFVLAMKYFSRLMSIMSKKQHFSFHHRCNQLKINHALNICWWPYAILQGRCALCSIDEENLDSICRSFRSSSLKFKVEYCNLLDFRKGISLWNT